MKTAKLFYLLAIAIIIVAGACTKYDNFPDAGGSLPTNYITILANGKITPTTLTVASGSSITFVNNHAKPHRIVSLDADSSIYTTIIPPDSSFLYKNDTLLGSYTYKCLLDSTIAGSITIRP